MKSNHFSSKKQTNCEVHLVNRTIKQFHASAKSAVAGFGLATASLLLIAAETTGLQRGLHIHEAALGADFKEN